MGVSFSHLKKGTTLNPVSMLVERRSRDRNVASSNPGRSGGVIFFSRVDFCVLTLIRCPFHPRVTAAARKRPPSFCQKCRWQVTPKYAYMPLTQRCRNRLTVPLSRHSVGPIRKRAHTQLVREHSATVVSAH